MKKLMTLIACLVSTQVLALTKCEVDRLILSCTQKGMRKVFRRLMEDDLQVKPNSRTLVILLNKAEKQDHELVFDDSPFRSRSYYTLWTRGAMAGRLKYKLSRPIAHGIAYDLSSQDEDGHVRTDLKLKYTPRSNPQDAVDLKAEYLPSIIYTFDELIRDSFGRIAPESTIKAFKVRTHPLQHADVAVFKEVVSGQETAFGFDSRAFMECIEGAQ